MLVQENLYLASYFEAYVVNILSRNVLILACRRYGNDNDFYLCQLFIYELLSSRTVI